MTIEARDNMPTQRIREVVIPALYWLAVHLTISFLHSCMQKMSTHQSSLVYDVLTGRMYLFCL